jgi:hypothetical protein
MTQMSIIRRMGVLAALFGAACSGRLAVLDEPVGSGTDDLTTNRGNEADPDGSGCDLEQWQPGSSDTPRPIDCGVCRCMGDRLVCDERPCLPERPIVECATDPYRFETTLTEASGVRGNDYHVEVMGPGGCGDADYVVCYEAPNLIDNPLGIYGLRVLTPPEAAACDAVAFQTFAVDLTPMTSLLAPGSGLIEIGRGIVQLGELSCADHQTLAWNDVGHVDVPRTECQADADCVGVYGYTRCTFNGCRTMATNAEGAAAIRAELQSIDAARCGPFFDAGCEPPTLAACDGSNAPEVQCLNGWCTP